MARKYKNPQDIHKTYKESRSLSQLLADRTSEFFGSWKFIIGYLLLTFLWVAGNMTFWAFDKPPFILYTFSVSVLAILMSGLILLSGNRQAEVDRAHAESAYHQIEEIDDLQRKEMEILGLQNEELAQIKLIRQE